MQTLSFFDTQNPEAVAGGMGVGLVLDDGYVAILSKATMTQLYLEAYAEYNGNKQAVAHANAAIEGLSDLEEIINSDPEVEYKSALGNIRRNNP